MNKPVMRSFWVDFPLNAEQYSKLELASLLLTQILSWDTFTWEFAEESPPPEFFRCELGSRWRVTSLCRLVLCCRLALLLKLRELEDCRAC